MEDIVNIEFSNPNILAADGYADKIDYNCIGSMSIRCPYCNLVGAFRSFSNGISYRKSTKDKITVEFIAALRMCPNDKCRGIVLTSYSGESKNYKVVVPNERLDFDSTYLPNNIRETLEEAIACHSVGANRAAALMIRRLLEELCHESKASGSNLHARLADLRSKVVLPNELFDAMSALRVLGNDAAHIEAKMYDNIGKEEAEESIELAKEIVKAKYQLKHLVERLKARQKSDLNLESNS